MTDSFRHYMQVFSWLSVMLDLILVKIHLSLPTDFFGGARSKGFEMLRNVSKLPFFDKIGQAKSVGFRFYSAI